MLEARGLTRTIDAVPIVDGVDLHVGPSEVLGLVGPNGGGKSTCLWMLAGLVKPTSGTVTVAGRPAHTLALEAAGTVGLITAEPGLYPALTLRENLHWFAGLYGRSPAEVDAALPEHIAALDLAPHLDRPAGTLSSGQRQKASLVRALLLDPAVLLFDEPTANLDALAAHAIHRAIRARADAGIAIVLCTHDLHAAAHICDRVVVLQRSVRAEESFDGPREPPPEGRLHAALASASDPIEPAGPAPPPGRLHGRVLHIALREWRELGRYPAILWICGALLTLLAALSLLALALLQALASDPSSAAPLAEVLGGAMSPEDFLAGSTQATLTAWNFLVFSQYLGFVGVLAGHALLHDRQVGTLPFLLLAPVRRRTLLAGKVLGALVPLTALTVVIQLVGGLVTLALPLTAGWPELTPRGLGWWAAMVLSGPAWAAFVATTCTVVSSLARDVRMAQQAVWFVVFFVQLLVAFLITGALGSVPAQLGAAGLGVLATAVAMGVGGTILSRDLGR